MKPNDKTRTVESTLAGDEVEMGIDQSALAHIMGVLTDLYADPAAAIVREYATNALDAHIEAGFAGPIEVTTPNEGDSDSAPLRRVNPTLTIRDYGIGLDKEGIRSIYSQYGASTKRGTDEQVGMLGLGCKSALTYSDQFTVVGIKSGIKTTIAVSRDAEGKGTMTVLSEDETDEANGVTVQIPAKQGDATELLLKARQFFAFWPEGTVLLNGEEPDRVEGFALSDTLTIVDNEQDTVEVEDRIVMGNVAYPAEFDLWPRRHHYNSAQRALIARVEIGDVDFAPSREALMDTKRTRDTIERIKDEFKHAAEIEVNRRVQAAANKGEALEIVADSSHALGVSWPKVQYQGAEVPERIALPDNDQNPAEGAETLKLPGSVGGYGSSGALSYSTAPRELDTREARHAVWVTDFAPTKLNADQRRKLDGYADHKSVDRTSGYVLLRGSKLPDSAWLEGVTTWSWTDLRKWRDPNAVSPATGRKITGTYYVLYDDPNSTSYVGMDDGYPQEMAATDLPDTGLVYVEGTKLWGALDTRWGYNGTGEWSRLRRDFPEAKRITLVVVPQNRIKKFERDLPHATKLDEWKLAHRFAQWDALSDADKAVRAWQEVSVPNLHALDPAKLDDPDLAELVRVTKRRARVTATSYDDTLPKVDPPDTVDAAYVTERYPLLSHVDLGGSGRTARMEALYFYINSAHEKAGKEDA